MKKYDFLTYLGLVLLLSALIVCLTGCAQDEAAKGDPGAPGKDAAPVTVLTHPAAPTDCANGGTVVQVGSTVNIICNGLNGNSGPQGAQGPIGQTGAPGADLTPVTLIQFCPGVAPSYPGVFPEVGLCIADQLYGVYSANNGFMVLLPPGAYSSNAIGSSCSFTVAPHCQVQ